MDKIAVLIPCYNEELSIVKVIQDCHRYIPEAKVYVYDNNSTDKSVELANQAGAIVRHEYQQECLEKLMPCVISWLMLMIHMIYHLLQRWLI